jgi:nucleoside-diphosphate-sugar epimerase/putative sterol carrier protein
MKVVVTGGSGELGTILLRRLAADRSIKSIVSLDVRPPMMASPKLTAPIVDVRDAGLERYMAGADALFHFAFLVTQAVPRDVMRSINVDGTKNVIRAALSEKVPSIVYASSVAAYGVFKDHPQPIVEETPRRYQSSFMYAATKFEVEAFLDEVEPQHPDVAITRLRPAILTGRRMDHALGKVLAARMLLDPGSPPLPWVWDEDVADAAILAFKKRARGAFNLVASDPVPGRAFAEAAGFRYMHVPRAVLRALAMLPKSVTKVDASDPAWLDATSGLLLFSTEKAKKELGWKPRCPTTADVARRLGEVAPGSLDPRLALLFRMAAIAAKHAPPAPDSEHLVAHVHLEITGPGGGDVGLHVENGRLTIRPGEIPRPPSTVLTVKKQLLLDLFAGKTTFATAQLTGKVKVEGEPMAMLVLGTLVAVFRKQADEGGAKGWPLRKLSAWMAMSRTQEGTRRAAG